MTKFLYEIRQKYFKMDAKDYNKLTSDFKYQSNTFLNYFKDLKNLLEEIKEVFSNISQNVD